MTAAAVIGTLTQQFVRKNFSMDKPQQVELVISVYVDLPRKISAMLKSGNVITLEVIGRRVDVWIAMW